MGVIWEYIVIAVEKSISECGAMTGCERYQK